MKQSLESKQSILLLLSSLSIGQYMFLYRHTHQCANARWEWYTHFSSYDDMVYGLYVDHFVFICTALRAGRAHFVLSRKINLTVNYSIVLRTRSCKDILFYCDFFNTQQLVRRTIYALPQTYACSVRIHNITTDKEL